MAARLAVNQNTILKVYNELCRDNILKIERGDGTYVSSNKQTLPSSERKKAVANVLRKAAVQAIHLEVSVEKTKEMLQKEYEKIISQRDAERKTGSSEK